MKRKLLLAGGAIGLLVLAISVAAGADENGDSGSEWSGVIDEARHQMESQAFDGVVVVEWHDPSGTHRAQMEVRQHAGVVEVVNADRTVASDSSSVMLDGQAWTMLSRAKGGRAVPDLTHGKYEVVRSTGPAIAGQATTRYEAKRDGHVVERLFVQDATGLVLRREVLDGGGDVARSVSFMRMNTVTEPAAPPSTAIPEPGPAPVDHLARPYDRKQRRRRHRHGEHERGGCPAGRRVAEPVGPNHPCPAGASSEPSAWSSASCSRLAAEGGNGGW